MNLIFVVFVEFTLKTSSSWLFWLRILRMRRIVFMGKPDEWKPQITQISRIFFAICFWLLLRFFQNFTDESPVWLLMNLCNWVLIGFAELKVRQQICVIWEIRGFISYFRKFFHTTDYADFTLFLTGILLLGMLLLRYVALATNTFVQFVKFVVSKNPRQDFAAGYALLRYVAPATNTFVQFVKLVVSKNPCQDKSV